jgi:hypothetical protein
MILRRGRSLSEPHCALRGPILEVSSSPQDRRLRRLAFRIPRLGLLVSQALRARRYLHCQDPIRDTNVTISKRLQQASFGAGRAHDVGSGDPPAGNWPARDKKARHTIFDSAAGDSPS